MGFEDGIGKLVMKCQLCNAACHAGRVREFPVLDGTPVAGRKPRYRQAQCKLCMCHDCIQMADDPVRQAIAPAYLNQTTGRPFNLQEALRQVAGELGMAPSGKAHALPQATCGCGKPPKSRCINCDAPLCAKCVAKHRCKKKTPRPTENPPAPAPVVTCACGRPANSDCARCAAPVCFECVGHGKHECVTGTEPCQPK